MPRFNERRGERREDENAYYAERDWRRAEEGPWSPYNGGPRSFDRSRPRDERRFDPRGRDYWRENEDESPRDWYAREGAPGRRWDDRRETSRGRSAERWDERRMRPREDWRVTQHYHDPITEGEPSWGNEMGLRSDQPSGRSIPRGPDWQSEPRPSEAWIARDDRYRGEGRSHDDRMREAGGEQYPGYGYRSEARGGDWREREMRDFGRERGGYGGEERERRGEMRDVGRERGGYGGEERERRGEMRGGSGRDERERGFAREMRGGYGRDDREHGFDRDRGFGRERGSAREMRGGYGREQGYGRERGESRDVRRERGGYGRDERERGYGCETRSSYDREMRGGYRRDERERSDGRETRGSYDREMRGGYRRDEREGGRGGEQRDVGRERGGHWRDDRDREQRDVGREMRGEQRDVGREMRGEQRDVGREAARRDAGANDYDREVRDRERRHGARDTSGQREYRRDMHQREQHYGRGGREARDVGAEARDVGRGTRTFVREARDTSRDTGHRRGYTDEPGHDIGSFEGDHGRWTQREYGVDDRDFRPNQSYELRRDRGEPWHGSETRGSDEYGRGLEQRSPEDRFRPENREWAARIGGGNRGPHH